MTLSACKPQGAGVQRCILLPASMVCNIQTLNIADLQPAARCAHFTFSDPIKAVHFVEILTAFHTALYPIQAKKCFDINHILTE